MDEEIRVRNQTNRRFYSVIAANILLILGAVTLFVVLYAANYALNDPVWIFTKDGLSFLSFFCASIAAATPYIRKWNILALSSTYKYQVAYGMNLDEALAHRDTHDRFVQLTSSVAFVFAGAVLQGLSLWYSRS